MTKNSKKLMLGLISLVSLVLVACTKKSEPELSTNATGRYVEKSTNLPENLKGGDKIILLEDESYCLISKEDGVFISTDQCNTWIREESNWLSELLEEKTIVDVTGSKTGEYAIVYEDKTDLAHQDIEDQLFVGVDYFPSYMYVNAEGQVTKLRIETESTNYIRNFYFTKKGTLVSLDMMGNICEVNKENGIQTLLYSNGQYIDTIGIVNDYVIMLQNKEVTLFNIDTNMVEPQDIVLNDFFKELNINVGISNIKYPVTVFGGNDTDRIYIATKTGIYSHVIGGNTMEMIVDGSITSIGTPNMDLMDVIIDTEGKLLALFSTPQLVQYTYEIEAKSVPEQELEVYSLYDNQYVRQVIAEFMKGNSDVNVKYEIGISSNGTITIEDALKNLNTRVLAKEGPDIIIMDGINIDTYIKKGMLEDLISTLETIEKRDGILENIKNNYKEGNSIYAIPAKFSVPMLVSSKDNLAKITNLESIADLMEKQRKEQPKGSLFGTYIQRNLLDTLLIGFAPSFVTESNSVDEVAITNFLLQAKRIYQAEDQGVTADEKDDKLYATSNKPFTNLAYQMIDLAQNKSILSCGYTKGIEYDLALITSIIKVNAELDFKGCNIGYGNVYKPSSIMAMSAVSTEKDLASSFIQLSLSQQVQVMNFEDGYPVNKQALNSLLLVEDEEKMMGVYGVGNGIETYMVEVYPPSKEQCNQFLEIIEKLDTPNSIDVMIEDIIKEYAGAAMNGTESIENVVKTIVEKIKIRLAE